MKVIICLDDNGGMLFNNRRQSRDKEVLKDIINNLKGEKLFISPFSEKLFDDYSENVIIDEEFLIKASENDTCFVENNTLKAVSGINEIVVYKWNRVYPTDFKCSVDLSELELVETIDFKGFSHEKITKETYKR
ncbi:MAG: hypothetical protein E7530_01510 [Ruminococcaceae bacterium]|nr:hypothetical protein [Oscillospiraceae bacterium]